MRHPGRWLLGGLLALAAAMPAIAAAPASYPRSYANLVASAHREGQLRIYSTTDVREVDALLRDFRSLYPQIRLEYVDINSHELYSRFLEEVSARKATADLLWSSAMDLQIKLVNDGYAQAHASPEKPYLPPWAIWKNEAYGITAEPIVFVYNKRLVPTADIPRTRADLERLLSSDSSCSGKIATMDPERSGTGFLYITQDLQVTRGIWRLVRAMGRCDVRLYTSAGAILNRVSSGEHALAYNTIGSYALERAARDPEIGVVLPQDYTLIASRIALIPADAGHPAAAKVFLDYLLSKRGQTMLARKHMTPVRHDVVEPEGALDTTHNVRAIRVGPELLAGLDQIKRKRFLRDWRRALEQK